MNKSQLKEYVIKKARDERFSFHRMEDWSKEYFRAGKKDQAKEWANYADITRARWGVYMDMIKMLGAEEEYFKADMKKEDVE